MPLKTSIFGSLISIFLAGFIAFLSSEGSLNILGIPSLIFCAIYSFSIHWIFFVHGYFYQTEHYFDATGSFTSVFFPPSPEVASRKSKKHCRASSMPAFPLQCIVDLFYGIHRRSLIQHSKFQGQIALLRIVYQGGYFVQIASLIEA